MEITVREEGETQVVMLNGKLDTNTTPQTETEINALIDDGANSLLINFSDVSYISSSGLRLLLSTAKRLKSSQGELKVCCLNEMATEVFEISGFNSILNVFSSEADALSG